MPPSILQPSIFISVGSALTPAQQRLVQAIDDLLLAQGFEPVTIGRTIPSSDDPLALIRDAIQASVGTIVLAFASLTINAGEAFPATPHASMIAARKLCTVWNQIEAAMTYQAGHPVLILAQEEVHAEGLIDVKLHPRVDFTLTDPETQLPPRIRRALTDWLALLASTRVLPRYAR